MATKRIAFLPMQQSGLEELAGGSPQAVNIVVDKLGCVYRRPAIVAASFAPDEAIDENGIDGVHITSNGAVFVVGGEVPSRHIYRIAGNVSDDLSVATGSDVRGFHRPTFAETESLIAIAGDDLVQKVVLATFESSRLEGDPPLSSHVIANSSRLLANNYAADKGLVSYSAPAAGSSYAGFEDWAIPNGGFFTAESRPDPVVAIAENSNEVFVFGATSLQVMVPDATFVFQTVSAKEHGCIAPYSVAKVDQEFVWLDHLRRVVSSDGRSAEVISDDIQRTLDDIATVDDAFGFHVKVGFVDAYCLCFPSDGRTFVFQKKVGWCTWMGWNPSSNNYTRWETNAVAYHPLTGQAIVGTLSGFLGRLALGPATDLGGGRIVVSMTTGVANHGTNMLKECLGVTLTFKRGQTELADSEPIAHLSWRDDGGPWSPPLEVGLGYVGDEETVVNLRSLGVYRRRQWKIYFDGDDEFVLVDAMEEFNVLEG